MLETAFLFWSGIIGCVLYFCAAVFNIYTMPVWAERGLWYASNASLAFFNLMLGLLYIEYLVSETYQNLTTYYISFMWNAGHIGNVLSFIFFLHKTNTGIGRDRQGKINNTTDK